MHKEIFDLLIFAHNLFAIKYKLLKVRYTFVSMLLYIGFNVYMVIEIAAL